MREILVKLTIIILFVLGEFTTSSLIYQKEYSTRRYVDCDRYFEYLMETLPYNKNIVGYICN